MLVFFLSGCVQKTISKSEPYTALVKTPKIKFHDTAFVYTGVGYTKLEMYTLGQPTMSIEIANMICMEQGCLSKSSFNEQFLNKAYPVALLENVLRGEPIYNGYAKRKTAKGFRQKLKSKALFIDYRVEGRKIYFKDSVNKIKITLTKIKR